MTNDYAHLEPAFNQERWIDAAELAARASISERKARHVLARAALGQPWRGVSLIVRFVSCRGAPNGLKREVLEQSLPPELRAREPRELQSEQLPAVARTVAGASAELWQERLQVIGPALRAPARSAERAELIKLAADRHQVGERTIRAWIAAYEARGVAGLAARPRTDRGERRILIARNWDCAVELPAATKEDIATKLQRKVRSLWAHGAPGWRHVVRMASVELAELTRGAGAGLPEPTLHLVCLVPRYFVERERRYQLVATKDKDAKAFFDHQQPRVRRSYAGLLPSEIVVADVHHLDVQWQRPDGTVTTPKLISWLDLATQRLFTTVVFCAPGEGVRREHVAGSFIDMTQHPEWGVPQRLYLDNGSEFVELGFVDDAMRLADLAQLQGFTIGFRDDAPEIPGARRSTRRMIINAQPYNAPGKPKIEGVFGILERGPFAMLPGWVGGNRMRKKTHNVGKEPVPFDGTESDFAGAVQDAIDYYHTHRQTGQLGGKSPNEALAEAVAKGWQRIDVDRAALEAVFARDELRTVRQGEFSIEGRIYRHDALLSLLTGSKVRVRIPVIGDRDQLPVFAESGAFLCIAEPAPLHHPLDRSGARDKRVRSKMQTRAISLMRRDVDPIDLQAEMRRAAAVAPAPPAVASAGIIRLAPEHEAVATATRERPSARRAREAEIARRDRAATRAAAKKLLEAQRRTARG